MTSALQTRPALRFALALAIGIAGGQQLGVSAWTAFAALGILCALSAASLRRPEVAGVLLVLAVCALGAVLVAKRLGSWEAAVMRPVTGKDEVRMTGLVLDEPARSGRQARFVLYAESLEVAGTVRSGPVRIMVRLRNADSADGEIRPGVLLSVVGMLDPIPRRRNPGERDPGLFYLVNGITGALTSEGSGAHVSDPAKGGFKVSLGSVRRALADVLERHHEGDVRSYLKGIVLALRGEMSQEQREAFLVSGTFHVIAVSGLHIGLIALMLHAVLGLLRLPRKARAAAAMAGLALYMVLVGSTPSVARAVIMACVVLGGRLIERPVDVLQSLGVAASAVLLIDPVQLFDPGFQLSFGAVLGIVTLAPSWLERSRKLWGKNAFGRLARATVQLTIVSLSAQAGTIPITALQFERISVVSLAANLVVVPLSSLNVALGTLTVGVGLVSDALAAPYAALNTLVARGVLETARLASALPGASLSTAGWSAAQALALGAGMIALLSVHRPRVVKWCLILALALADASSALAVFEERPPALTLSVLDVGQGDAIVIESGDGHAVLIDGGPATPEFDTGERVLVPFFERRGIAHLDAIVLSHAHGDHTGGVAAVLEALRVDRLLVASDVASGAEAELLFESARRRGTVLEVLSRGSIVRIGQSVRLYVLHPAPGGIAWRNLNNSSIVCKLVVGGCSVLLPGDIESDVEAELVEHYGSFLRSDVLKVPHHGSSTSSSEKFLDAVRAREALISVGWRNRFEHPSPGVMRELALRGVRTRRTDREGALVLTSDGQQLKEVHWHDQ